MQRTFSVMSHHPKGRERVKHASKDLSILPFSVIFYKLVTHIEEEDRQKATLAGK